MNENVGKPKKSLLGAIVHNKCPACREGDFFCTSNPYNLSEMLKMHDHCPKCNQRYSLEPGFYFGAAYISYGLNVAVFVAAAIGVYLLVDEPTITNYVLALIIPSILLAPILYRLSRLIWAAMFIPFGGEID